MLLYTWPGKNEKAKPYIFSFVYIYPYFHQNWTLFVPPPSQNFSVYVNYKSGIQQSGWHDLFYELNSAHQANRLAGNESALLALSNSLRYYVATTNEKSEIIQASQNVNFQVLEKVIRKYIEWKEARPLEELSIIIGIRPLHGTPHFHYYKN